VSQNGFGGGLDYVAVMSQCDEPGKALFGARECLLANLSDHILLLADSVLSKTLSLS
jgi:hypothetical protein